MSILINLHTFHNILIAIISVLILVALARVFWRSKMVVGGAMALW